MEHQHYAMTPPTKYIVHSNLITPQIVNQKYQTFGTENKIR